MPIRTRPRQRQVRKKKTRKFLWESVLKKFLHHHRQKNAKRTAGRESGWRSLFHFSTVLLSLQSKNCRLSTFATTNNSLALFANEDQQRIWPQLKRNVVEIYITEDHFFFYLRFSSTLGKGYIWNEVKLRLPIASRIKKTIFDEGKAGHKNLLSNHQRNLKDVEKIHYHTRSWLTLKYFTEFQGFPKCTAPPSRSKCSFSLDKPW